MRWKSASAEAQRPSTYHFVSPPSGVRARSSTWIQVPGGVDAFHDGTACANAKPGSCQSDVHVPVSYVVVPYPCGSVYERLPRPLEASVSAPPAAVVPAFVPVANEKVFSSTA